MELRTPRFSRGMTLIELMIVVVIATILLSIAVPSYMDQVRRSRRTEARTALLDLAGREERFMSTNGANYSQTAADLGYAGFGTANPLGSGYYYLTVASCATGATCGPNGVPGPSFALTATPMPGTPQANDSRCQSFTVDSVGSQFATPAANTVECWSK